MGIFVLVRKDTIAEIAAGHVPRVEIRAFHVAFCIGLPFSLFPLISFFNLLMMRIHKDTVRGSSYTAHQTPCGHKSRKVGTCQR